MRTALAIEVAVEAGIEPQAVLAAKRAEAEARSAYARAVDVERAALRMAAEWMSPADCPHCIRCVLDGEIVQTLLCVQHTGKLHALRQATKNRIAAQRRLSDAAYELRRVREAQR